MNAPMETVHAPVAAHAAGTALSPARRFGMLLRREWWEHRGGVLWAPLIAGAVSLLLWVVLLGLGIYCAHQSAADGGAIVHNGVTINGLDLGALAEQLSNEDLRQLADGLYLTLLMSSTWPFLVMIFVAFFYCLGALYDDRNDRSVLFWKSLPVSDAATVLSKVVTATLVIPLVATLAAIAVMFLFLSTLSIAAAAHGANPLPLLWGNGTIFVLTAQYLAAIPVYAAWALPTVGWLLLCSAWARSKPFLWALLVPLGLGVATSMSGILQLIGLDRHWAWGTLVTRMLLGTVPITGQDLEYIGRTAGAGGNFSNALSIPEVYANFTSVSMWVGIVAGAIMIFAAIQLRRHRELAS